MLCVGICDSYIQHTETHNKNIRLLAYLLWCGLSPFSSVGLLVSTSKVCRPTNLRLSTTVSCNAFLQSNRPVLLNVTKLLQLVHRYYMLTLSTIFLYYIISMLIVSEFSPRKSRHSSIAGFDVWTLLAADVVKEQGQNSSTSQALKPPPAADLTAAMPINIRGFIRLSPCLCSCLVLSIHV